MIDNRILQRKVFITLFILVTTVLFFLQNRIVPFFSDDIWWIGSISGNNFYECFNDFISDQQNMWLTQNGRAANNIVMQLIINAGEFYYDVFISLVFFAVIVFVGKLAFDIKGKESIFLWVLIPIFLLYLSPDHCTNFYWAAGGCNYLWSCLLSLLFICAFKTINSTSSIVHCVVISLLALAAGGSHEIFALPISFSLFCISLYSSFNKTAKKLSVQQWLIIIAYWIGSILIVVSPGTRQRIDGTMSGAEIPLLQAIAAKLVTSFKIFRYGRCFYILLLIAIYCFISKKNSLKTFTKNNAFLLISLFGSLGIVVILGVGGRAVWGVEVFSAILILRWLNEYINNSRTDFNKIGLIIAVLLIAHQAFLIKPFKDSWSTYDCVALQSKAEGFKGTARMEDWHSDNLLIDSFVAHPYEMMMQDMWLRVPLNCNVCKAEVYDALLNDGFAIYNGSVVNIHGDFITPYNEENIKLIEEGRFQIELEPISSNMKGGFLFITWHKLLQWIWPNRYPKSISVISQDEYSILKIGDNSFIRFDKPIRPIARDISKISFISEE